MSPDYDVAMAIKLDIPELDLLVDPLSRCLDLKSARRIVGLKANARFQAAVNKLAEKCNQGQLTPSEEAQYEAYALFGTFVAVLKSKARRMLAESSDE